MSLRRDSRMVLYWTRVSHVDLQTGLVVYLAIHHPQQVVVYALLQRFDLHVDCYCVRGTGLLEKEPDAMRRAGLSEGISSDCDYSCVPAHCHGLDHESRARLDRLRYALQLFMMRVRRVRADNA